MKNINWKSLLPHIVAVAIFFTLTFVYFSPIFLENKVLPQGDITSYEGWGNDLREYHKQSGEYAFWSNAMFGGMPATLNFMPPTYNVFKLFGFALMLNMPGLHIGMFFMSLLCFYIMLLAFRVNWKLSIIGSIAYAFLSYNLIIIDAGHVTKGLAMATIAPIIGGVALCYRGKYILGSLMTLLFTGVHIYFNHQQISYYLLIMLLVLAFTYFVYALREKTLAGYFKTSLILLCVGILAVMPAADKLLPTMDYSKDSMRGGSDLSSYKESIQSDKISGLDIDYAFQWSYGKMETMTLLIPNFYGASSHYNLGSNSQTYDALRSTGQAEQFTRYAPMYWGTQPFTSGPVYAGAIICFLFVLGLFILKGPEKWFLLVITIISVVLSWGRNLMPVNEFLFDNLPLYNKFRTPSMALVMAGVSMALMAILALKELFTDKDKSKYIKSVIKAAEIPAAICLFFALFGSSLFNFTAPSDLNFPDWLREAISNDRAAMLRNDAWRSLAFIALSFGVLYLFLKKSLKENYALVAVCVLVLVDMWTVDKRFLNNDHFVHERNNKIVATPVDNAILQDKSLNYRVLNLTSNTFNESKTSYFHKSVGGYSPAKLSRYQDIIDVHFADGITPNVINMLNTKYIIVAGQNQQAQVQLNDEAMGNAWFVSRIEWQDNPMDEILALKTSDIKNVALIDKSWESKVNNKDLDVITDSTASIVLEKSLNPGHLLYKSSNSQAQLAVFSEIFYKTWHAYIDGKEVPIVRVNYILRGIEVPAGEHSIEFKCVDDVYNSAAMVSKTSSLIVIIIVLALSFFVVVKKKY